MQDAIEELGRGRRVQPLPKRGGPEQRVSPEEASRLEVARGLGFRSGGGGDWGIFFE